MDAKLLTHLRRLNPSIDVHGKWAFIANPKVAQQSIMGQREMDARQIVGKWGRRNFLRVWNEVIASRPDEVFWFTFVRNPWDKMVSAVHYVQQRKHPPMFVGLTFEQVLKDHLAVEGPGIDRHFRAQIPTLMFEGKPTGIFVGRFERLRRDWTRVARRIGVSARLPHHNKTNHRPYTEYYDDEGIEIVRRMYAEEIELLGYRFGQ